jgi:YD repeat-containing protein
VAGNLTAVTYPTSTSLSFSYDALSRLTSMVDAAGTTSYGYDTLNRLLSEDGPWASDTVSYSYNYAMGQAFANKLNQPVAPLHIM